MIDRRIVGLSVATRLSPNHHHRLPALTPLVDRRRGDIHLAVASGLDSAVAETKRPEPLFRRFDSVFASGYEARR
jgi:hypothetical protein